MTDGKRIRLLARVRDLEDKLERLARDLPREYVAEANIAHANILELRENLEAAE